MPRNVRFASDEEPEGPHFRGLGAHFPRGILRHPTDESMRAHRGSDERSTRRHHERRHKAEEEELRQFLREREQRQREEDRRRRQEAERKLERERQLRREAEWLRAREKERQRERERERERELKRLQKEREDRIYDHLYRRNRDDYTNYMSRDELEAKIRAERKRREILQRVRERILEDKNYGHRDYDRVFYKRYGDI